MNRLHIATRGASSWRERLADPENHWRRRYSALETAVSWECAGPVGSGLPEPVARLFEGGELAKPELLLAVAEHKVRLDGKGADAQCDVWALVKTAVGTVSLSVEAKANEPFGAGHEPLGAWLKAGKSESNRQSRWAHVKAHLPAVAEGAYEAAPFQILQRCAAAVIEARRFGLTNAAFLVQAFSSPEESFQAYARFCQAVGVSAERSKMNFAAVGDIRLGIGWADCLVATDAQLASVLEGTP